MTIYTLIGLLSPFVLVSATLGILTYFTLKDHYIEVNDTELVELEAL